MACGHNSVRNELTGLVAAEVAIEAFFRTGPGPIERIHAAREIRSMSLADRIMGGQPAAISARAAVAAFATDAILRMPALPFARICRI